MQQPTWVSIFGNASISDGIVAQLPASAHLTPDTTPSVDGASAQPPHVVAAALVIADVTPNNENVFYELGFAHAIGKTTILLSDRKRERLPFDIAGFRTLFYDNTIGGKGVVESRLKQHLVTLRDR